MRTATFKAINGSYKISQIGVTGALGIGTDTAQKVNEDGSWGDLYVYNTLEGTFWLDDGWYKADGVTPVTDDDILNVGEGLFVSAGADFTLTFSGEVIKGQPTVVAPAGMSMIGSPLPADVKIGSIEVTGALGIGTDTAQKVNADGSWGDLYVYNTLEGTFWLDDGWYQADGVTPVTDEDVLAAGESLFISSGAGMTLKFPAVIGE